MHGSIALAVAAALAAPAAAHADALYHVDVSVRKSVVVETRCPDGSRHFDETSHIWRGSGSGRLPGGAGIVAITHTRLTAKAGIPKDGEPVEDVDREKLDGGDHPLRRIARYRAGRIVLDLGRMSPVERKLRVRAPAPHSEVDLDRPGKERRKEGEKDADGCTPTTIRATDVTGSVQRLR